MPTNLCIPLNSPFPSHSSHAGHPHSGFIPQTTPNHSEGRTQGGRGYVHPDAPSRPTTGRTERGRLFMRSSLPAKHVKLFRSFRNEVVFPALPSSSDRPIRSRCAGRERHNSVSGDRQPRTRTAMAPGVYAGLWAAALVLHAGCCHAGLSAPHDKDVIRSRSNPGEICS